MRVAISGASGLVGKALARHLEAEGMQVLRLVRGKPAHAGEIPWDPAAGKLDPDALSACDAVVNLSGENIAEGRWSAGNKRRIVDSRVQATRTIVRAMGSAGAHPRVLINASAVGYYGNGGEHVLTEHSPLGAGFLADVCRQWEAEALRAEDYGVRVVRMRLGVVLSTQGACWPKCSRRARWASARHWAMAANT